MQKLSIDNVDDTLQDFLYRLEALEVNHRKVESLSKRLEEMMHTLSMHWADAGKTSQPEPAEKVSFRDESPPYAEYKKSLEKRLTQQEGTKLGSVAKASTSEPCKERVQWKTSLGSTDGFVKAPALEMLDKPLSLFWRTAKSGPTDASAKDSACEALGERLKKVEMACSPEEIVKKSEFEALSERLTTLVMACSPQQFVRKPECEALGERLTKVEMACSPGKFVEKSEFEVLAERLTNVEKSLPDGSQLSKLPKSEKQSGSQDVQDYPGRQPPTEQPTSVDPICPVPVVNSLQDASASSISDKADYHLSDFMSHVNNHIEYIMEESVWDIMMLCSFRIFRWSDIVAIYCTFIANVSLQVSLSCLIWAAFTKHTFDDLEVWKRWRVEDAHNYAFYSPTSDTSLATRVCQRDSSLSIATSKVELLLLFDDYHQDSIGMLTCMGCIMIFFVSMTNEMRKAFRFAHMCMALRSPGAETRLKYDPENESMVVVSLSFCHVIAACVVASLRMGIAIALLIAGSLWLVQTPRVVDLILNVVAIELVIQLDDSLFQAFLPNSAKAVCRCLESISVSSKLDKRFPNGMGMLTFASLCAFSMFFLITEVIPMRDAMRDIEKELCLRGRTNFVVFEQSKTLLPYIMPTNLNENHHSVGLVVEEILSKTEAESNFKLTDVVLGDAHMDPTYLRFEADLSIEEINAIYATCSDQQPYWWISAFENIAVQTGIRPDFKIDNVCGVFESKCHEPAQVLLRMLCPKACKCDEARGGLYFAGKKFGCPDCLEPLCNVPCEDPSPQQLRELPGWQKYWQGANEHFEISSYMSTFNVTLLLEQGCDHLASQRRDDIWYLCEGPMVNIAASSLASFCPQLCECASAFAKNKTMKRWCPQSCRSHGDGQCDGGEGAGYDYGDGYGDGGGGGYGDGDAANAGDEDV